MGKKSRARKRAESRRAARENESHPRDSDCIIDDSVADSSVPNSDLTSSDEHSDLMSSGLDVSELSMAPSNCRGVRPSRLPIRISGLPLSCASSPSSSPCFLPGEKKSRIPRLISLRDLIKSRSGYNSETSDDLHLESFTDNFNDDADDNDDNGDDDDDDSEGNKDVSDEDIEADEVDENLMIINSPSYPSVNAITHQSLPSFHPCWSQCDSNLSFFCSQISLNRFLIF